MTDRIRLARLIRRQHAELLLRGRKIRHLNAEVASFREQARRMEKQWLEAEKIAKEPRITKRALDGFTRRQKVKAFLRMQLKLSKGQVEAAVAAAEAEEKPDGSGGLAISRATAYRAIAEIEKEKEEEMKGLRVDFGSIDDGGL